jgi:hypothetical protein
MSHRKGKLKLWMGVGIKLFGSDFREFILDYPGRANIITSFLKSRRRQKRKSELPKVKNTPVIIAGFEGGGRKHEPRNVAILQLERAKNGTLFLAHLQRNTVLPTSDF